MTRRHLSAVPDPGKRSRPYAAGAAAYHQYGWSPLPLPPGEKTYPPTGYTGGPGRPATSEEVQSWMTRKADGNICLRMPRDVNGFDVLGIDVDTYGEKAGRATLAAAVEAWGELPPTWRTTSRPETDSGIQLFLVPTGLAWPGQLPQGGGVELVRWDHRYAVVAPSVHPDTGAVYTWVNPEGEDVSSEDGLEFPAPEELPLLPPGWVEGLTSGKKWEARPEEDLDPEEVTAWILERPGGEPCAHMDRTLNNWLSKVRAAGEDGGAHDSARDGAWAILGDAAGGHTGLAKALGKLRATFKEAIKSRRGKEFEREWNSIKARGVRKIAAEGGTEEDDPCQLGEVSREKRQRRRTGSADMDYKRDDTGNAMRLVRDWQDSLRFVEELGGWHIWSEGQGIWTRDKTGEVTRMAIKTVDDIEKEVEFLDETDANYSKNKSALLKFITKSRSRASLNAMKDHARDLKGVTVPADLFNADPTHIVTPSGTIVLGSSPRRIRSVQEHHNTITTGVPYDPEARSPYWDKFLERFQPDVEIREWLQKLAGYSLLGKNPGRFMVVCLGPTSTGKTTFAKAMQAALGDYATATNMTVFRDSQDERARADLIKVLTKRFIYAEEASNSWHLHPDQIKRLTGGSPISARRPYASEYVEMVPAFTPWLMTNAAPTIEGADAALWRRLLVVPFFTQIPQNEEDAAFETALLGEGAPAILAWMVEGYRAYAADPDSLHRVPTGALGAIEDFKSDVSDFARALNDIVEKGADYKEAPASLYDGYLNWCEMHHVPERERLSGTKFGRELNGLGYAKKQIKIDGRPTWVRLGLRLRPSIAKIVQSVGG